VANAEAMGARLLARLRGLAARYPLIGDVRGKGLLTAVEFVADRESMAPLPPAAAAHAQFVEMAYARGLIVYSRRTRGGHSGDHVLVAPPLIVTEAQLDEIAELLDDTLAEFSARMALQPA
jgi:4-aminobutyrate aminotransferase-like enzyme